MDIAYRPPSTGVEHIQGAAKSNGAMGIVLSPGGKEKELPSIKRECIAAAVEAAAIGEVGRVAIGAMGSVLPVVEMSEGYSALRAPSTDRKSVTGAVGSVPPSAGKG